MSSNANDSDWAAGRGSFAHDAGDVHLAEVDFDGMDSDEGRLMDEFKEAGMTAPLAKKVAAYYRRDGRAIDGARDLQIAEFIRSLVERIGAARNPAMMAEAARIAFDFRKDNDDSVNRAAAGLKVSVWGLKKAADRIRSAYRLSGKTSFDKSERARATYRITNGRCSATAPQPPSRVRGLDEAGRRDAGADRGASDPGTGAPGVRVLPEGSSTGNARRVPSLNE